MRFLAFILGSWVYVPFSIFIRMILRLRGVKVGCGFRAHGIPQMKIVGRASHIVIGNHVTFAGHVDLRNRENGKIVIGDHCRIDEGVRLVAANDAVLSIGAGTVLGLYSVFNCGTDVAVGEKCMVSGFVYVQSSNHGVKKGIPIQDQPRIQKPIQIGNDVWLASHVTILPGVHVGSGAVIGAKAVVTKDIPENAIAMGVPAQVHGERV